MAWRTWRGVLGGGAVALILTASALPVLAQGAAQQPNAATAKAAPKSAKSQAEAGKPGKPAAAKIAARKPESAHPSKTLAAAKPKLPAKKLAAAPKKPAATKTAVAAAGKSTPAKVAAAARTILQPSYTITTTRGNVTTTATRIVPLSPPVPTTTTAATASASHAPGAPLTIPVEAEVAAATPVSLTQPAEPAKPMAAHSAVKPTQLPPVIVVAQPADSKAAASFVANFLQNAFHLARLDGASSLQRRAELAELFASKMDVKRIAGYTTADGLAALSPEAQQRFRTILVSYLVETYYPQLELASDPSVKVDTAAADPLADGTAVVWTTFTKDGWGSQSVKWQLASEGGSYKIIDIFSAGASLVQMERDTFQSVMRQGGLPELMTKLDARTKELASAATE
jgi:ABC-type transporter MlaC component